MDSGDSRYASRSRGFMTRCHEAIKARQESRSRRNT